LEYEWPPYASRDLKDPALLTGWKGYDIDLLDYIAQKAGFTYEIAQVEELDFSPQGYANLAPNEQLERGLQFGDAMLSYWSRTTARCNHPNYTMLYGHLDSSKALIARQIPTPVVPLEARLLSFMRPFKYELWACLFLMVLASGVVDYLLENRRGPRSGNAEAAPEAASDNATTVGVTLPPLVSAARSEPSPRAKPAAGGGRTRVHMGGVQSAYASITPAPGQRVRMSLPPTRADHSPRGAGIPLRRTMGPL